MGSFRLKLISRIQSSRFLSALRFRTDRKTAFVGSFVARSALGTFPKLDARGEVKRSGKDRAREHGVSGEARQRRKGKDAKMSSYEALHAFHFYLRTTYNVDRFD